MATLAPPDIIYKASYLDSLHEGFYRGVQPEKTAAEIKKVEHDFETYVRELNDKTSPVELPTGVWVNRVPGYLYWLVEGHEFIGEASIRYELSAFLLQQGGHIGYGIRPSRQRKGYGMLALRLSLDKLKQQGILRALVTCDDDNIASYKIIERNGGVLEDKVPSLFHQGHITRRYWIDLGEKS